MKKGDLSVNIIIVTAIALLILVIISVLLFRSGGKLDENVQSCSAIQGVCGSSCDAVSSDMGSGTWVPNPARECTTEGDICCVKL